MQAAAGRIFSAMGCLVMGQMTSANVLDEMLYRSNNRKFEPARTALDWLSRDPDEVDAHCADPLCGFICSYGFFRDLFAGFDLVYGNPGVLKDIPASLPMFIAAGGDDPIGGARGAVQKHERRLRAIGIKKVDTRLYPGARHELLRETNRDHVMADIIAWLDAVLHSAPRAPARAMATRTSGKVQRDVTRQRRR